MKRKINKNKMNFSDMSFHIFGNVLIWFVAIVCLLPFVLPISGSFSSEADVTIKGFTLIPEHFSLEAYKYLLADPTKILSGYRVTIIVTVIGTIIGVFITAMTGYVLARKGFMLGDAFAFYIYFTTLFGGGLLPFYMLIVRWLQWKNTWLALIFPGMLVAFNIFIMKNFCKGIPHEICESGLMDGASEFQIFFRLYMPMMKPALATVGMFKALGYWNNWNNSMLYADKQELHSLQYILYRTANGASNLVDLATNPDFAMAIMPTQTVKMAMTVVAIGPIILLYPFVQKFFVQGMTVGAVKG